MAGAQSFFIRREWIRAFLRVSLRGLPRVCVHFHIFLREVSVCTPHGSPKLCGFPVQRRVVEITTHVWVRCAPCVTRTVRVLCAACHARAVRALSPGFLRKAFTLSMTSSLKRGKRAHQPTRSTAKNYRDKFDTTDPQRQVETADTWPTLPVALLLPTAHPSPATARGAIASSVRWRTPTQGGPTSLAARVTPCECAWTGIIL